MPKRTLTVRAVPDPVLRALRASAAANRRSLNSELLVLLEQAASEARVRSGRPVVSERVAHPYPRLSGPTLLADQVDRDALAAVCRRHHIRSLALFGSAARGQARPDSDVDVLVEFETGMTPGFGIVAVAEALSPVFGGRRVDLVTRRGLPPRFRENVQAGAVPLYAP